MNKNNIPLIVISAGIGNFITSFLNGHNILFPNIYIASNILKFENGLATSYVDNIIHSFNKEETSLPESIQAKIKTKKSIILLGDQISDLKMVKNNEKNLITIGFLSDDTEDLIDEYRNNFDIVCTNDISYQELFAKILNVEI